jgi:hypothetical protein
MHLFSKPMFPVIPIWLSLLDLKIAIYQSINYVG